MLEQELAWLKEHLSQLDSPVVFCHNDLLCKNIIYDSDKGTALHAPHMQRTRAVGWSADLQETRVSFFMEGTGMPRVDLKFVRKKRKSTGKSHLEKHI